MPLEFWAAHPVLQPSAWEKRYCWGRHIRVHWFAGSWCFHQRVLKSTLGSQGMLTASKRQPGTPCVIQNG